ncbi:arginine--tRNA ligase [Treponema parvum]|uniref:Arginine--tRNA ligase n=1 Tax=Treponema parvum TaxID=138851 RepID=A0A975F4W2_9SPIR|nr:arginine--tRNA ligase [Treponema parvum]QTQ14348.1 arginine--tRNA ligase [Treponema parvum]
MSNIKNDSRILICAALNMFKTSKGISGDEIDAASIQLENPPDPDMGDLGSPMFIFAKVLRTAPPVIAQNVVKIISENKNLAGIDSCSIGEFVAEGPYVNIKLNKVSAIKTILNRIYSEGSGYGSFDEEGKKPLAGRRVMVEYSSPNTNKPLHLGHMRNDALGESVSRILKKAGAEVFKVNIINNRGIHICKSMLAYKLFHEPKGETPETMGMKSDHFVGQCYVEFDKYSKEHPEANKQAESMLLAWESGDKNIHGIWERMNDWAIEGIKTTYDRTGVSFDKLYYESETYLKGKKEILEGLEKGIFYKEEDGSVWVDLKPLGMDKNKVLLRKDGTSLYMTQDIGTAIFRHDDWPFNQLVYVVASEQIHHFKVLFYILKKLGYEWADKLYHLSYGLVNLPSGRMKSREGTVVDADDLIDQLHADAVEEIKTKGREDELDDVDDVAEKVALAALNYYLLQITPVKDMLFNPEESLSFNGNTGPYLQYMGARIASILRKAQESNILPSETEAASECLTSKAEWDLVKSLGAFPSTVLKAANNLDPSLMATYLYDISKLFGKFYQSCPILGAETEVLQRARLLLAKCTLTVLKNAMELVLIPYLDKM